MKKKQKDLHGSSCCRLEKRRSVLECPISVLVLEPIVVHVHVVHPLLQVCLMFTDDFEIQIQKFINGIGQKTL